MNAVARAQLTFQMLTLLQKDTYMHRIDKFIILDMIQNFDQQITFNPSTDLHGYQLSSI